MKKACNYYLLLIVIILFSCSKNNEIETGDIIVPEDEVSIPETGEERAISAFNDFINNFNAQPETRSEVKPTIANVRKMNSSDFKGDVKTRSENEELPIYKLTLQNADDSEGYAIITEEQLNYNVVAYVPNGSIADTASNFGLSIWFEQLAAYTTNISTYSYPANQDIWQNGWEYSLLAISGEEFYRHLQVGEQQQFYFGPIERAAIYAPYVPTTWGQGSPYNDRVTQTYYNRDTRRYETCAIGCFAVAIGQLSAFHRHPANYYWSAITANPVPDNSTAKNAVSGLLYDIAISGDTHFNNHNGYGQTNPFTNLSNINKWGYNAKETYYSRSHSGLADLIFNEMLAYRPTLISARSGSDFHIWVIDGLYQYERYYYYTSRVMPSNSPTGYEIYRKLYLGRLVHCNWGADGRGNGWYYDFIPQHATQYHFDYDIRILTEITPKR